MKIKKSDGSYWRKFSLIRPVFRFSLQTANVYSVKIRKNFHDMDGLRFRNKVNRCILLKYPIISLKYCKKVWTKYMKKSQKIFCVCKNLSQEVNKTKSLCIREKTEKLKNKFCKNVYISKIIRVILRYLLICVVDN